MIKRLLVGVLVAGSMVNIGDATYAQLEVDEINKVVLADIVHVSDGIMKTPLKLIESIIVEGEVVWAKTLYEAQGRYVNFWVENVGESAIYIDINGVDEKLIDVGESAYAQIDIEATGSAFCIGKVRATENVEVSINYRVAQRDNN